MQKHIVQTHDDKRFYREETFDNETTIEFGYDAKHNEVTSYLTFKQIKVKNKKHTLRKFNCHLSCIYMLASIKDVLKAIETSEELTSSGFISILESLGFTKSQH